MSERLWFRVCLVLSFGLTACAGDNSAPPWDRPADWVEVAMWVLGYATFHGAALLYINADGRRTDRENAERAAAYQIEAQARAYQRTYAAQQRVEAQHKEQREAAHRARQEADRAAEAARSRMQADIRTKEELLAAIKERIARNLTTIGGDA